ncbi:MAG TPA: dephospho-CoA kinase [Bacillota bacterium]|nr:dephospho-CoA kinase [Bacillota bacterium]HPZ90435.1 dephospho-CoA kinase [Bacillota bacterium]HQE01675.1 dephospho-CoA kinase [Bacillota bacterium]
MEPVVIGLTGGIACGKSTVAKILKRLGAAVIDADREAKRLLTPHGPVWKKLVEQFGAEILNPDQSINRRRLGNMVFGNAQLLAKLNAITHPGVMELIARKIQRYKEGGRWPAIVLDAPLLYEAGADKLADVVWVVAVDRKTQIDRLMKRDNIGYEQALQRIEAQMPLEEKIARADAVIYNNGTRRQTRETVLQLWQQYVEKSAGKDENIN